MSRLMANRAKMISENKKRRINKAYVHLSWRILVYLKANPDLYTKETYRAAMAEEEQDLLS